MNGEVATSGDLAVTTDSSAAIASGKSSATTPTATQQDGIAALTIAALGVDYGDIGTSPLYALRECFHGPLALPASADNVMGVLSLKCWQHNVDFTVNYARDASKYFGIPSEQVVEIGSRLEI